MKRIYSFFVKLLTGIIASALLITLPSYSSAAAVKDKTLQKSPANALIKKALTWGGAGEDMGISTAMDGSGNIYVTGYFNDAFDFNPGNGVDSHTSNGGRDVFLSKFDASKNFLWTKTWGGGGDDRGQSIGIDGLGNVYVAGPFRQTVDFDPGSGVDTHIAPGTENDAFLSKFDANGNFQWARTWGGSTNTGEEAYSLAVDGSGNIYVVGDFSSLTLDFDPGSGVDNHTNHGIFDAFVTKFDSSGNFIWAKTWGGEGYDDSPGVAVDSLGNVYVGGMYGSTDPALNFDPAGGSGGLGHPAHDSGVIVDAFLSKFDSSGNFQWVRTWGGPGKDDVGQSVTVDKLNNIYVGGRYGCTGCDFDPSGATDLHSSNGELDAFVSKFDSSGNFQWAKTWGGSGWDAVGGFVTDNANNLYVTGPFKNAVDFGSGTQISADGAMWDVFLSKLDAAGTFQWVQTWGGSGHDVGNSIVSDTAGNVYVTGFYNGTVDLAPGSGGDIHTSNGVGDTFLMILNDMLTISGNAGTANATLNYTDGTSKTATADGSGNYSFTVPFNWSGTVTPSKSGYTFSPANKNYSNLKLDQADSFIASPIVVNSKVLTAGRAIANWPAGIPAGEKRPVVVFLPGWNGSGAVDAAITEQNTNLVNEGYVTLAIGFDDLGGWVSDIEVKTLDGLNNLCADTNIPANCNAIILDGSSYGGAQNYWVMEYLQSHGYNGKALGFVSEDAGYGAPGTLTNATTGAYTRTGLANTASYSVAMIENTGDTTFPIDECTWGNCGIRVLSNAHKARGDTNVFSMCPIGGAHGTRGYANWNVWVISAIKTMLHVTNAIPTFTGYVNPPLNVSNACVNAAALPGLSISGTEIMAGGKVIRLRGVNMGDPFWARGWYGATYSTADYATLAQDWHANVVRISIFPTQWKNMERATLLAGLAQEVNAALDNGMYVIISYHVIGWPNGWYQPAYAGNPSDTYDSSLSLATSFWAQMSQIYGSDTRIIFDLWNEPAHDASDWANVNYWTELKPSYESLIQTVRNNGAQNIVLATGSGWASWLAGIKDNPLTDPKVVYAYHKYSVNGSNTAAQWNQDTGGLIGVKPVIVSEWGYEDTDVTNPTWPGSQASYGDAFTQWMDSNHLNSLAWMYHHDWTPALLKSNGSLTLFGTFVKGYFSTALCVSTRPDLIVTNVTLIPAEPKPNETFKISITIRNQGGADAVGDIYRDVYIDRNPVDDLNSTTGCTSAGNFSRSDKLSLAPGMSDTKTIIINGGLSEAQHQIWVYVDARCQIDE